MVKPFSPDDEEDVRQITKDFMKLIEKFRGLQMEDAQILSTFLGCVLAWTSTYFKTYEEYEEYLQEQLESCWKIGSKR